MPEFVIMTDSCCDLTAGTAAELGLEVLPLRLELDGQTYRNELDGREISFQDFYAHVRAGGMPVTSAVNVGDFEEAMLRTMGAGKDVLCLCFSSALSTTYQSAVIAADYAAEKFPERKVFVVDTRCASLGQGLLVWLCARERQKGGSIEKVRDFAEATKWHVCQWFTVDDLNHLKRGGRVSATAAFFGSMLSIKPVLWINEEGRLIPMEKYRGRRASLMALVDHMAESVTDPENVFISHGDCLPDAELVAAEVRRRFHSTNIYINYVGPVIGSHSGPGTLALFFIGGKR